MKRGAVLKNRTSRLLTLFHFFFQNGLDECGISCALQFLHTCTKDGLHCLGLAVFEIGNSLRIGIDSFVDDLFDNGLVEFFVQAFLLAEVYRIYILFNDCCENLLAGTAVDGSIGYHFDDGGQLFYRNGKIV